jgi:hypothetical protein
VQISYVHLVSLLRPGTHSFRTASYVLYTIIYDCSLLGHSAGWCSSYIHTAIFRFCVLLFLVGCFRAGRLQSVTMQISLPSVRPWSIRQTRQVIQSFKFLVPYVLHFTLQSNVIQRTPVQVSRNRSMFHLMNKKWFGSPGEQS